jgi:hypothetical protein
LALYSAHWKGVELLSKSYASIFSIAWSAPNLGHLSQVLARFPQRPVAMGTELELVHDGRRRLSMELCATTLAEPLLGLIESRGPVAWLAPPQMVRQCY